MPGLRRSRLVYTPHASLMLSNSELPHHTCVDNISLFSVAYMVSAFPLQLLLATNPVRSQGHDSIAGVFKSNASIIRGGSTPMDAKSLYADLRTIDSQNGAFDYFSESTLLLMMPWGTICDPCKRTTLPFVYQK